MSFEDITFHAVAKGLFLGRLLLTGGRGVGAVVEVSAVRNDNLWSSFHVNANGVVEVLKLDGDNGSFKVGVEGNVGDDAALLSCHNFVHWDLSFLKPLDK